MEHFLERNSRVSSVIVRNAKFILYNNFFSIFKIPYTFMFTNTPKTDDCLFVLPVL